MIRILRAAQQAATPWKNGGGLTRELAVHPAGSDLTRFDWRVSVAQIRAAGPFSHFPGIDRRMAVLEGRLGLYIGGDPPLVATPDTPPLVFAGEVPVSAEPQGGAVTDLNVMTRRGRFDSRLTLCGATEPWEPSLQASVTLVLALSDLAARCPTGLVSLARLDALLIEGEPRCAIAPRSGAASFWLVEIAAG